MKAKKILASLLASAMVLGTMAVPVFAADYVAQIGEVQYTSLVDAVNAALPGETVTMLSDITITATTGGYNKAGITVDGITLDGNNHTFNVSGADETWDCGINIKGGTVKNLTILGAFRGIFTSGFTSDIIIENCYMDDVAYPFNADGKIKQNGSLIVKDSKLNGWTSYGNMFQSVTFTNCEFGAGTHRYTYAYLKPYQGSTFVDCKFEKGFGFDASTSLSESGDKSTLIGCESDGVLITDSNKTELLGAEAANAIVKDLVASVGDKKYTSLAEAFAALDGKAGTINVLKNCSGSGIIVHAGSNITVDFDGHTYTVDGTPLAGSTGTQNQMFQLLAGSTVTMKNGTLLPGDEGIKRVIQNYSNLTLDNMTIDMTDENVIAGNKNFPLTFNNGTSVIRNSVIKTGGDTAFDVYYWPTGSYTDGARLTIEGDNTVISGKVVFDGDGTADDTSKHWLKINGGTFDAVEVTNNSDAKGVSVSGGTFSTDPRPYLVSGKSSEKIDDNKYSVIDTSDLRKNLTTDVIKLETNNVTVRSATVNGEYDQVTAKLAPVSGEKTFTVTAVGEGYDGTPHEITLTGINMTGSGSVVCGLIITNIPDNVTVTVE